jgi:hypothetical protein
MIMKNRSSRRSFLKRGALLAVPLAASTPAVIAADDGLKARLAKFENEAEIRKLHQDWLRRANSGVEDATALIIDLDSAAQVRKIAVDHAGQPDAIDVAVDGKSATGTFHCMVEAETAIAQDCTIARMAHVQGSGFVRRTERRVLNVEYIKASGTWQIARAAFTLA